jgi:hypothetical protein
MSECERLTDRMIAVAHGGPGWNADEAAHLSRCPDCSAEWRLIQAAQRLGESAAGRIDPAQVSRLVAQRMATRRQWHRAGWVGLLAAAAAVVLIVWGGRGPVARETIAAAARNTEFHLPLAELDSLDAGQLQSVLDGLDAPIGSDASPDVPALGDLESPELERILRSLEG